MQDHWRDAPPSNSSSSSGGGQQCSHCDPARMACEQNLECQLAIAALRNYTVLERKEKRKEEREKKKKKKKRRRKKKKARRKREEEKANEDWNSSSRSHFSSFFFLPFSFSFFFSSLSFFFLFLLSLSLVPSLSFPLDANFNGNVGNCDKACEQQFEPIDAFAKELYYNTTSCYIECSNQCDWFRVCPRCVDI